MDAQQVGALFLEVTLEANRYYADLQKAQEAAAKVGVEIEKKLKALPAPNLKFTAEVNDSQLTNLNKHLDLKERHFDKVQRKFKNSPLKIKTDVNEIVSANKQIDKLQQRNSEVTKINLDSSVQQTPSVKLDTTDFRKALGEVQSSIEKTSRKTGLGDTLLAPFKAVSSAMSKVVEGVLFSVGAPVGQEIGEGIRDGISKESSAILGSFKLISREIAAGLTQDIISSLGTDANKIKNAIAGIVGESNLASEGAAVRGNLSAQSRQRQNIAGRQISEEYQSLIGRSGEIQAKEAELKARRSDVAERSQELQAAIKDYQEELGIDKLEAQITDITKELETVAQKAKDSPDESVDLLEQAKELSKQISPLIEKMGELDKRVGDKFKKQISELSAINEQLSAEEQQFERELEPLKQIDQIKPIKANRFGGVRRQASTNNPEYYKAIFGEVINQSGIEASRAVMPELVANPRLGSGVFGQYDPQTNQIQISEQALEAVKSGTLTMKQIETLIHELRHAIQFDFGRVDAERESLPIDLMRPSAQQLQQFSGNIERSTAHASSPETESRIRALEADAYSFADSVKDAIAASVSKSFSVAQFEKQFGIGGGKSLNAISVAQQQALMNLKKIKGLVDEYGVDIQAEISSTLKGIQSASASIVPLLDRASNLDLLSPQEIQELSEGLLNSYTEAVEQINQQVDAFKQQALAKVRASQQPQQSTEEFKAGLNEQYSAAGLRQVAQRLGYANTGKMKKSDLVELLGSSSATDVDKIIASLGDTIKKQAYRSGTGISLPKANEKAVTEQLKSANKRLQEMLKSLQSTNEQTRKQVVEQIVVETNKQINDIDKLVKEQQLSGKGKQRISGFRNYFEQVRSPLAGELAAINAASVNQIAKGTQGQGLAAFGDIREEVQKLFESFRGGAKIDPDLFYSPAAARVNKNLNKFGRAEQQINQRYEQAFSAPLQVGGSGSENTFTRIVRVVKSQIDASLIGRVTKFAGSLSSLVSGFVAFQGAQFAVGIFTQISQSVLETATAFESLERRINFTSGTMAEGAKNISFLRQQAKDLGLNLKQTLEGGAGFIGAVQGTPLEGARSRKILGAVNQATAVYGLDPQQQERGLLALQQTAGKGVVSQEELRGQLAEAIPNAVAVAARAYGVNTQELNKMVKAGLDSTEFLDKFAQQLSAETVTGVAGAANSSQAAVAKFSNAITELQESFGKLLLPLRNFSLNAITTGINTLLALSPQITALIQFLILKLAEPFWLPFINGLTASTFSLSAFGTSAKATAIAVASSIKNMLVAIAPLAAQFALLQVGIGIFNSIKLSMSDMSQEFGESVRSMTNELEKLDELLGKNRNDKGWFDGDILKKMFPDFSGATEEIKTASDKVNAIFAGVGNTRDLIARSQSSEFSAQVSQIQQIDKQLEEVQIKRRALVQLNPQDSQGLKELQAQETELLKNREKALTPVAIVQQGYKTRIDFLKKSLEELADLRDKGGFLGRESQYDEAVKQVTEELKNTEKAQDDLNKKIGAATTAFANLQKNIQGIADALTDVGTNITTATNAAKTALANSVASGSITPGQEQSLSRAIDQQAIRKQAEAQATAIAQTTALLNTDENKVRMRAFKVSENTGQARLKTLAESASNPEDKFLLEQMASLKDQRLRLSDLRNQLAQSRAEAQRALVDQTKQVADYYRSIARQAEEQGIEIKKLQNQINTSSQQNKLKQAILGVQDNIVTQFVDSIIDVLGQMNQASDQALDAQSRLLQNKNQFEDQVRQGIELSRSLPGQLPKIPVELDLSGVRDDVNIEAVNSEIDSATASADNLKATVERLERSWNLNSAAVQSFDSSVNGANDSVSETYKQLEQINTSLDITEETTKDWSAALNPVKDSLSGIGGLFGDILKGIESAIASTSQWLGGLVQGLQQAGQAFAPLTQNTDGSQGGLGIAFNATKDALLAGLGIANQNSNAGSMIGYASPSTTQSYQQVLGGSVSAGQSFFAPRPQRNGTHFGIDFDGTEGLGGNAPVQNMFPGVVQTLRAWGKDASDPVSGGSNAIRVASPLPNGQGNFLVDYGHMSMKANQVKEGQAISPGQLIGKTSNNDSKSRGGHLDIKIRIPSNMAGNFKNTAGAGGGMHYVDVKEFMRWYQSQAGNTQVQARSQSAPIPMQTTNTIGQIKRGGNDLSPAEIARLTPKGRQLYELRNNPNVLAIADTVARAEGTDFRGNSKNFGYGMLIGGENIPTNQLSTHPFVGTGRKPRHNSTASGRYQMMNFNWDANAAQRQFGRGAQSDLQSVFTGTQAPSFSPGVQDLYFIASLEKRGVLDEVLKGDLSGALGKSGINSLAAHYASLENVNGKGYYAGQKTPEGMRRNSIPFAQQRLMARLKGENSVVGAANAGQAASPQAMQGTIAQGMTLQQSTYQQQQNLTQQQSTNEQERIRIDAQKTLDRAVRDLRRAGKDLRIEVRDQGRAIDDAAFDAIYNPSPKEKFDNDIRAARQSLEDLERGAQEQLSKVRENTKTAQSTLATGGLPPEAKKALESELEGYQQREKELLSFVSKVETIKTQKLDKLAREFQRTEFIKARDNNFKEVEQSISRTENEIKKIEALVQNAPSSPLAEMLPVMRESNTLLQAELDFKRAIAQADDDLFNNQIDTKIYADRVQFAKDELSAKQQIATATRQQQESEYAIAKLRRSLENREMFGNVQNEILRSQSQLREYGVGTGNKLEINRKADLSENDLKYQRELLELTEMSAQGVTGKLKAAKLRPMFEQRNQLRVQGIEAQFKRNTEDEAIAAQERLFRSRQDVFSARSSRLGRYGVSDRAAEKQVAIDEQKFSYESQMRELDRLASAGGKAAEVASQLKINLETLNQVKLQEIADQFNPLIEVANTSLSSFQGFFKDVITGSKSIGDAFTDMIGSIADNLASLATQLITNEIFSSILGGGRTKKGGGVFGELFGGLGGGGGIFSILGGLFYNGGYVPNYAKGYNPIAAAMEREHFMTGRKPYLAVLSEGERVLNLEETRKFNQWGGDRILQMAQGGVVGSSLNPSQGVNGSGQTVVNAPVTVTVNGNQTEGTDNGTKLSKMIRDAVITTIISERKPGGSLYNI